MNQITLRNRPKIPPIEEKPGRHAKMTKQSQLIVERQQHTVFTYPNLSHYKPFFEQKRGFSGQIMVIHAPVRLMRDSRRQAYAWKKPMMYFVAMKSMINPRTNLIAVAGRNF